MQHMKSNRISEFQSGVYKIKYGASYRRVQGLAGLARCGRDWRRRVEHKAWPVGDLSREEKTTGMLYLTVEESELSNHICSLFPHVSIFSSMQH